MEAYPYRLAVADPLPTGSIILPETALVRDVPCDGTAVSFAVRVEDGGGTPVLAAPVIWEFGNRFAERTDSDGRSSDGSVPDTCPGTSYVEAAIQTEGGEASLEGRGQRCLCWSIASNVLGVGAGYKQRPLNRREDRCQNTTRNWRAAVGVKAVGYRWPGMH